MSRCPLLPHSSKHSEGARVSCGAARKPLRDAAPMIGETEGSGVAERPNTPLTRLGERIGVSLERENKMFQNAVKTSLEQMQKAMRAELESEWSKAVGEYEGELKSQNLADVQRVKWEREGLIQTSAAAHAQEKVELEQEHSSKVEALTQQNEGQRARYKTLEAEMGCHCNL